MRRSGLKYRPGMFSSARLAALAWLFLVPFLTGCPKEPLQVESLPPATQVLPWQAYTALAQTAEEKAAAYRIRATVQYETPGNQGHRLNALIWGNPNLPVRLDLFAGVGVLAAQVREDKRNFLLNVPEEQTAYTHRGSNKPLLNIGTPLPFTLESLVYLLCGRFDPVFGHEARLLDSPPPRFVLDKSAPVQGVLTLSESGQPLRWDGSPPSGMPGGIGYGWTLDIAYDDDVPALPRSLSLVHESGYSALLQIRGREALPELFPENRLELNLPPQTVVNDLGEGR